MLETANLAIIRFENVFNYTYPEINHSPPAHFFNVPQLTVLQYRFAILLHISIAIVVLR